MARKPVVYVATGIARLNQSGVHYPEDEWEVRYVEDPKSYPIEKLSDVDIMVVTAGDLVSKEMIDAAPNLVLIHSDGVSFNRIDHPYAATKGILVCNNKAGNAISVAEHTIAMVLDGLKRVSRLDRAIRKIGFKAANGVFATLHTREIYGMTIGLVGAGAIGREVAKRLSTWGANLIYSDPFPMPEALEKEYGIKRVEFDELCRTADAITVHVPVIESTTGMFGKEQFDMMKDGVVLVNVSRGIVFKEDEVIEACESGKIGCYCADVFTNEPPEMDDPLLTMSPEAMERLLVTTHAAGRSDDAMKRMDEWTLDDVERVIRGEMPKNIVNGVTAVKPLAE